MSYQPRQPAHSRFFTLRGLQAHCLEWGQAGEGDAPTLVLAHGWMDVAASYQFLVDALSQPRHVLALDWRGFGRTQVPATDHYWFLDYVADLDALLDCVSPNAPVDLLGHSMGGNVVMTFAGARPQRVRRLINLEGFGLPRTQPEQAPKRIGDWLDDLKRPQALKSYSKRSEVAQRLQANNPRLAADRADWLAGQWAAEGDDGRWHVQADPAHKRSSPLLYRVEEHLALWSAIRVPLLFVEGDLTELAQWWGQRYSKAECHERLNSVPQVQREVLAGAGHMLHHDQPQVLAALLERFLG
jgi:pimeloyl-ACP methyl ester carboxylesterase